MLLEKFSWWLLFGYILPKFQQFIMNQQSAKICGHHKNGNNATID
ncbi:hypothetical protein [Lacticaseibacillus zeae]|nr:hypothetical protein [Lacticaseibacillus zeae]